MYTKRRYVNHACCKEGVGRGRCSNCGRSTCSNGSSNETAVRSMIFLLMLLQVDNYIFFIKIIYLRYIKIEKKNNKKSIT